MTMLAEYGTLSLGEVLAPAIQMADGYPIEAETADEIEKSKDEIKKWKYSREVFLLHPGQTREAPEAGEVFVQKDLAATLRKLVETERQALKQGKGRRQAIYAAYDRFYKGDIGEEPVRGLLSKDYARARYAQIDWTKNDPSVGPGDPYPYQGGTNPFAELRAKWTVAPTPAATPGPPAAARRLPPGTPEPAMARTE